MKLAQVDNSTEGFGGFALEMGQEAKRMEGEMMCRKQNQTKQNKNHNISSATMVIHQKISPLGKGNTCFFGYKNFQIHEPPPGRTSTSSFSCLNAPLLSLVAWEGLELFCFFPSIIYLCIFILLFAWWGGILTY